MADSRNVPVNGTAALLPWKKPWKTLVKVAGAPNTCPICVVVAVNDPSAARGTDATENGSPIAVLFAQPRATCGIATSCKLVRAFAT